VNYILREKAIYRERFFSDNFLESNTDICKGISVIVVSHLIDTGIPYIKTIDKYFDLQSIIPKQKSINHNLLGYFPKAKILNIAREDINNEPEIIEKVLDNRPKGNKIVLLDIGGYFSSIGNRLKERYGEYFLGIIEDTENGYQKYLKQSLTYPLISVARSLLKENEDYLVGQAVVFSAEYLLREQGILMNGKSIGIIGIGKIGNGILSSLKSKSSEISIFDINPVSLVIAHSRGAKVDHKLNVLKKSDILFLATGNLSLKEEEYKYLKNGSLLFSVTSSDDEINISWLENKYNVETVSKYIKKYEKNGHYFFIANDGNAVNFIHGAVVDDFILLVQKEMIDTILELAKNNLKNKIYNGFDTIKERIADSWLNKILDINI
jgi:adenosylhomocysteinase